METKRPLLPLPRFGRVVRGTVEGKRRGTREDVFLVAFEDMSSEELAGIYLGAGAEVTDEVEFSLPEDQFGAILYMRAFRAEGSQPRGGSLLVASGVPDVSRTNAAPMSEEDFVDLVHEPSRLALEIGALEVARRVAERIAPDRVPSLWARQILFVDQLDSGSAGAMKGTDSYLYWALAVLYGNRNPFDDIAQRRVSFSDAELDSAEYFTSLASDVYFIQTGQHFVFHRGSSSGTRGLEPEEATASGGLAPVYAGRLFGFYFLGHDSTNTAIECAGYVVGVQAYPVRDSRSLERRVRDIAGKSGFMVDRLYVSDTGTRAPRHGGEIIALSPRK